MDMFVCALLLYLDFSGRGPLPLGEEVLDLTGCYRFRPGSAVTLLLLFTVDHIQGYVYRSGAPPWCVRSRNSYQNQEIIKDRR